MPANAAIGAAVDCTRILTSADRYAGIIDAQFHTLRLGLLSKSVDAKVDEGATSAPITR
jgi:hypothetical protein